LTEEHSKLKHACKRAFLHAMITQYAHDSA